jgi:hypothetical protein
MAATGRPGGIAGCGATAIWGLPWGGDAAAWAGLSPTGGGADGAGGGVAGGSGAVAGAAGVAGAGAGCEAHPAEARRTERNEAEPIWTLIAAAML